MLLARMVPYPHAGTIPWVDEELCGSGRDNGTG
jgi:hypothetical protein